MDSDPHSDSLKAFLQRWLVMDVNELDGLNTDIWDEQPSEIHNTLNHHKCCSNGLSPEHVRFFMIVLSQKIEQFVESFSNDIVEATKLLEKSKLCRMLRTINPNVSNVDAFVFLIKAAQGLKRLSSLAIENNKSILHGDLFANMIENAIQTFKTNTVLKHSDQENFRSDLVATRDRMPIIFGQYIAEDAETVFNNPFRLAVVDCKSAMAKYSLNVAGRVTEREIIFVLSPTRCDAFIMEPRATITCKTEKTVSVDKHMLYKVPGITSDVRGITRLISLILVRLNSEMWNNLHPKYHKAQDYRITVMPMPEVSSQDLGKTQTQVALICQEWGNATLSFGVIDNMPVVLKKARNCIRFNKTPIEVHALQMLDGEPEFVQMKRWWMESDTEYVIVMEQLNFIDMARMKLEYQLEAMDQILCAIEKLHDRGIIHRDIKTTNVMRRHDNYNELNLVIIDFDSCAIMNGRKKLVNRSKTNPVGTEGYIAPELYLNDTFDERVDIYSCGVMFAEWISNILHHREDSPACSARVSIDLMVPIDLGNLLQSMVTEKPCQRPSARELRVQLARIQRST